MKMLILNVIRLFILTLGATLVQASDVSDVAYCEAISNEISLPIRLRDNSSIWSNFLGAEFQQAQSDC